MTKYRSNPRIVEAVQWFPGVKHPGLTRGPLGIGVVTIHGQLAYISPGDYIIAEPDGAHYYPCKEEIFLASYEPVEVQP